MRATMASINVAILGELWTMAEERMWADIRREEEERGER